MNLEVINNKDFINIIKIRFNNILYGFDNYNYIELSCKSNKYESEENFIRAIESFYEINDGNLIIDFYKNRLNKDSITFIKSNLDMEDNIVFDKFIDLVNENNNYYKINDKKLIKLLTKLCTRELYFITFYFYKNPVTIWGNYNLKFPLFYEDNTNIKDYIDISKINNLY